MSHELRERHIVKRSTKVQSATAKIKKKQKLFFASNSNNPKRKKSWLHPSEPSTSILKRDIYGKKVKLFISGISVVYYELSLLHPGETINAKLYQRFELLDLKRTSTDKRPQHDQWYERLFFSITMLDCMSPNLWRKLRRHLDGILLLHLTYSPDMKEFHSNRFLSVSSTCPFWTRFRSFTVIQIGSWLEHHERICIFLPRNPFLTRSVEKGCSFQGIVIWLEYHIRSLALNMK